MEKEVRNLLASTTLAVRRLLEVEFARQIEGTFDIFPDGRISETPSSILTAEQQFVRAKIVASIVHQRERGAPAVEAVAAFTRECAFTFLNRVAALKLMESRALVQECVSRGGESAGFKEFCGLAPGLAVLPDKGYRLYLECLFDEIGREVGVLFNRHDSASLLWPARRTLEEVLEKLNESALIAVWGNDESIGWIYQYYNDPEERKRMRDESSAPRNSRELAVRNQFFTPRYVVEFLTDNTLGRLWYEMTRGVTLLRERCHYLVRRPTEIFMKLGESAPESAAGSESSAGENLLQEELLRQPVHIPHCPIKDPRVIRLLDPACGSMHFGLYAFDLLSVIYDEAWDIAHGPDDAAKTAETFAPFVAFTATFPDKAAFLREVPRLIVERNIHGIDIDPRAAQIAGLSLWLRAQRAWHQAGVKPADRPRIARSNLVCAEPMPGEKELLREFVEQQFPASERPAFAFLLEKIFDHMTLAGEAGSLLRIEEEIRSAIADAKRLWKQGPRHEQASLFAEPGEKVGQGEIRLDLSGITDEQFWARAEQRIYDALEAYAEQAENGGGFQRRLFADDAAQGFAFIDLCRKRYDVVVMNPPFGSPAESFEGKEQYPNSGRDIYAMFVERMGAMRTPGGRIGAILPRTGLFIGTMADLRVHCYLNSTPLELLLDLGKDVLDGATIRTACYVIGSSAESLACIRIGNIEGREARLGEVLRSIELGEPNQDLFVRKRSFFKNVPGSAIAYWIPERLSRQLPALGKLEGLCDIRQGIATGDNFRFLRLLSELTPPRTGFCFYSKGGEPVPFVSDETLYVQAAHACAEMKANAAQEYGSASRTIKNEDTFGLPGITYSQVNDACLKFRVHPPDALYDMKGPVLFPRLGVDKKALLAFLNSPAVEDFMRMMTDGRQWHVSALKNVPVPDFRGDGLSRLSELCESAARLCLNDYTSDEAGHFYTFGSNGESPKLHREGLETITNEIDEAVWQSYGATSEEVASFSRQRVLFLERSFSADSTPAQPRVDAAHLAVGAAFGRWDIRYATGERPAPELPNPFAPLPVCPPGMLQGNDGLPISPEAGRQLRTEGRYPLDVAWAGILVDDPEHPLDLERRVHAALAVLWGDHADALEHEACALLGVLSLREWFRRPAGFFADHLKRYSKSRRQAPIYWPLSSPNGLYTVWLYYHRLTPDAFFTIQREFVKPKLEDEERHLFNLKQAAGPSPTPTQAREIGAAAELVEDLRAFRDDVQRIAALWRPNLNDGVIINYAPLWRLVAHATWRKALKETWDTLAAGAYDWAHLALHLWPERVIPKCASDRSLAIAHDLETFFWVKDPKTDKWSSKKRTESEISALVAERSTPAVKAALESLRNTPAPGGGTVKRARKTKAS